MADPELESALHQMEAAGSSFATRVIRMAEVRAGYVSRIAEMSREIRGAVSAGELSARAGAEMAHEMRNQILEMQRAFDYDLGRSIAQRLKTKGITLEEAIARAMQKLGVAGKPFQDLTGAQQHTVLLEVIDSAGRSRPKVTAAIPRLRWAGRGLWLASFAIAGYNVGTATHPWWQTGREAAAITGGLGGGFVGGAAMGAAGGVWAGPIGIGVGIVVGGILGALLADHAYVEAAGTADPATRSFVARFTSAITGTDEQGMAAALAREHRGSPGFVRRVFLSLDDAYHTDADDVALAYVKIARSDRGVALTIQHDRDLRDLLIRLLDEGFTDPAERKAIELLRSL